MFDRQHRATVLARADRRGTDQARKIVRDQELSGMPPTIREAHRALR
ncbi:hypothetical protein [Bradyrhizobium sp. Cp5.3]|nr:hypothetical protein [Bradyrhizobium sp. Cp5.3]